MGVARVSFHLQHLAGRMDKNKKNIAYVRIKTEEDENPNENKFQSIKLYITNLYAFIHPKINHLLNNHSNLCIGLMMILLSIFLFTVNIFLIKRFSVIISDILFVRSMIQLCGFSLPTTFLLCWFFPFGKTVISAVFSIFQVSSSSLAVFLLLNPLSFSLTTFGPLFFRWYLSQAI